METEVKDKLVTIRVIETVKGRPRVSENARVGISPEFDLSKGTTALKIGISREDWKKFYEPIFGDYDKFYDTFQIMLTNKQRTFDLSEPKNQIIVALLKNHSFVAKSMDEVTQNTLYLIYDEVEEARKENLEFEYELRAYKHMYDMSPVDKAKFLKLFGYRNTETVSPELVAKRLKDKAKEDPKKFVEMYEDKARDIRIMIEEFLSAGILKRIGGVFYFGNAQDGVPMGSTHEQVVEFIRDPKNNDLVDQLLKLLKDKK